MSRSLPPLDLHAHVAPDIAPRALEGLGAVVFAVTRSLDEFEKVKQRSDAVTVWGLGCHPGLTAAQNSYDAVHFGSLLQQAAFVGEVGLDSSSKVPIERQAEVFQSVLAAVATTPRLISVHSYRATKRVLDLIEQAGIGGAILHWWLGSVQDTRRAIDLGCVFSVNRSMDVGRLVTAGAPLDVLLPETDHPYGDRAGDDPRQPGWTEDVERLVSSAYGISPAEVRAQFWVNLESIARRACVVGTLPRAVQSMLQYAASIRGAHE